jgi:hypothetical protein
MAIVDYFQPAYSTILCLRNNGNFNIDLLTFFVTKKIILMLLVELGNMAMRPSRVDIFVRKIKRIIHIRVESSFSYPIFDVNSWSPVTNKNKFLLLFYKFTSFLICEY